MYLTLRDERPAASDAQTLKRKHGHRPEAVRTGIQTGTARSVSVDFLARVLGLPLRLVLVARVRVPEAFTWLRIPGDRAMAGAALGVGGRTVLELSSSEDSSSSGWLLSLLADVRTSDGAGCVDKLVSRGDVVDDADANANALALLREEASH